KKTSVVLMLRSYIIFSKVGKRKIERRCCNKPARKTSNPYINHQNQTIMNIWRVILAIICPPLAVIDKGCGSIIITFLLWLCGWVPGVIAALVIVNNPRN